MILAVDIGNSDVVFGLYQAERWQFVWRTPSKQQQDSWHFSTFLKNAFEANNLDVEAVQGVVLSSVVPKLTPVIQFMLATIFGKKLVVVGPTAYQHLDIQIDNPNEIGTDLVANAVAAFDRFKQTCIVVDFGTALTITSISAKGQILGVAIAPGIKTAMRALAGNAAQLPEIPLALPNSVVGKNTIHAIQAGILWGYVGLVEGLLNRTKVELATDCKVIATGGLSFVLEPLHRFFDEVDRQLTLEGLRLIAKKMMLHKGKA